MIDIKYTAHSINDQNEFYEYETTIRKENLILPEDLNKYIGKVVTFHNGVGYVVTGILTRADVEPYNPYNYSERLSWLEYRDELDMSWYYTKDNVSEYETLESAYEIVCHNIHLDEEMHNVKYIAIPTKEELEFRERILSMNSEYLDKRYHELKELVD